MSSWRATLRIARRDALRARGRSLLVVAMIGLPVLGVTAVDVVRHTVELSPEQQAVRTHGAADAVVEDSGLTRVEQGSDGSYVSADAPVRREGTPLDVSAALPPGTVLLPDTWRDRGVVGVAGASARTVLRALDYTSPVAQGLYTQVHGRPPAAPDEVAVTTALAQRLGIGTGDRVVLDRTTEQRTVVGVVADAASRTHRTVLLAPGALAADQEARTRYLVDLPGALTWEHVQAVNAVGGFVDARADDVEGAPPAPPPFSEEGQAELIAAISLVVGMALLEVVLLAGPAFAVGAKRSARQLALVSATGGEARDVRRVVLGGGLVLGTVGAVLGAAGGVALAAVGMPLVERFDEVRPGPFEVPVLEVLAIVLLGIGTALLAAWLPARAAARQDVVAALTGRRGTVRGVRGVPVLGLVTALVGAAIAYEGARQREVLIILVGSILAELGLVAMTPWLVGVTGRLGPLLPVAPRLALRDAARNRGRTAPAVSAILAAVAGCVAVGTFVTSQDDRDRRAYTASAVHGSAVVPLHGEAAERVDEVVHVLERELPAAEVLPVQAINAPGDGSVESAYVQVTVPGCPASEDGFVPARCAGFSGGSYLQGLLVGDAQLVRAVTGAQDDRLALALQDGGAVVPARYLADDGTATLAVHEPEGAVRRVTVPAQPLPDEALEQVVLSPQAAQRLGQPVMTVGAVARTQEMPSAQQQDRVDGGLDALGIVAQVYVERGHANDFGLALIALAIASALLVLGASGIATGLAAADGRADLSTLAAVGATPGLRRRLAGAQSFVTAGLGTALGVAAGLVPAAGLIRALNEPVDGYVSPVPFELVVPWVVLAVVGLVVPLLAVLAAMVLTRSRLPLVRRLA